MNYPVNVLLYNVTRKLYTAGGHWLSQCVYTVVSKHQLRVIHYLYLLKSRFEWQSVRRDVHSNDDPANNYFKLHTHISLIFINIKLINYPSITLRNDTRERTDKHCTRSVNVSTSGAFTWLIVFFSASLVLFSRYSSYFARKTLLKKKTKQKREVK